MIRGKRRPSGSFLIALAFTAVSFCASASAEPNRSIVPSTPPGTYSSQKLITFTIPAGTRLVTRVDGAPPREFDAPLLLSAEAGRERSYTVDAELRSLGPDGTVLGSARFSWAIDRKPPAAPTFVAKTLESGYRLTASIDEPGTVTCLLYNEAFKSTARESLQSGESVFVPVGTSVCAWGTDLAGNSGKVSSPDPSIFAASIVPFKILSPVAGVWANPQVLAVESAPGVNVFYSLDGSDPSSSGLDYSGPVQLDPKERSVVRVVAVDASGSIWSDSVSYSVIASGDKRIPGLQTDTGIIDTKEFGEISVPSGFRWSVGDSVPSNGGTSTVVFSAVRGMVQYHPLIVTDGEFSWRWICVSGTGSGGAPSTPSTPSTPVPAVSPAPVEPMSSDAGIKRPIVAIYDWHFIGISWDDPVYVSRDKVRWQRLLSPVIDARDRDSELFWFSEGWKGGEVQRIELPRKPSLSGLPPSPSTANPVVLSIGDARYEARYEVSSGTCPPMPSSGSPNLANGLLLEVPQGTSTPFNVRVLAEHGGIAHGELTASFSLDRKIPREPSLGIDPTLAHSRLPVRFVPTGEDMLQISIEPASFSRDGAAFVLEGDPDRPIEYSISAFAVDAAGNVSPTVRQRVTIDLNAIRVDPTALVEGSRDGSLQAPYDNLDDALDGIIGSTRWRISVSGRVALSRRHVLSCPVSIDAAGAEILAGPDATIRMNGANLSVRGGKFLQRAEGDQSSTLLVPSGQTGTLIEMRGGSLALDGVEFDCARALTGPVIKATAGAVMCVSSVFSLSAPEYSLLFEMRSSALTITACKITARGESVTGISLVTSRLTLTGSTVTLVPGTASRAVEAWLSRVDVADSSFNRVVGHDSRWRANRDTAFWVDGESSLRLEPNVTISGFWREIPEAPK